MGEPNQQKAREGERVGKPAMKDEGAAQEKRANETQSKTPDRVEERNGGATEKGAQAEERNNQTEKGPKPAERTGQAGEAKTGEAKSGEAKSG